MALDDAQAGKGLARTGAVGEQHAVAVRLGKPRFGQLHILLLAGQQLGQRGLDAVKVRKDNRRLVRLVALDGVFYPWSALVSNCVNLACCDGFSRYSCDARITAWFTEVSSGNDARKLGLFASSR